MSEFQPDTIVRNINTGTFGKIVKRYSCCSGKMPIHYEVMVEDKQEGAYLITVINHSALELECLPMDIEITKV